MKKYILSIALSAVCLMASASALEPDTLLKVTDVNRVVISETSQGVSYSVAGSAADSSLVFNFTHEYTPDARVRSRQSREINFNASASIGDSSWDVFLGGLGFGMVSAPGAPRYMQLEMPKSFEINWLYALGIRYIAPWNADVSLGIGFVWRNYRSTVSDGKMIAFDGDVLTQPWHDGSSARNTAIKTFAMQFPLLYNQRIGVRVLGTPLAVSLGPVLNVSTYASVKSGWIDSDGQRIRECANGVGQRKLTVDFLGILRFAPLVSVYARYSPQSVLQGALSPRFKSFSVGLMLGF